MLKKINIEKIVSTVEQTAKDALGSAVHAADQNDDGKFNMEHSCNS